mmetsp:Transcript_104190/g.299892  ORF Transcript_104190/g.299892 Transcript_104190/m.299892 type:complete len:352 (-) Transcript_104190:869-1924(-)
MVPGGADSTLHSQHAVRIRAHGTQGAGAPSPKPLHTRLLGCLLRPARDRAAHADEGVPGLPEWQPDDHRRGDEGPRDADEDPEGPIVPREDARGQGEHRPHDHHEDGEAPAPSLDPRLRLVQESVLRLIEAPLVVFEHLDLAHRLEVVVLRLHQGEGHMDNARRCDGHDVPREVRLQDAQSVHGHLPGLRLRVADPSHHAQDHAAPDPRDGADGVRVLPHEHVPEGHHRGADGRAHEAIDPTQVQAHAVQGHGKAAHACAEDHDHDLRHQQDPIAVRLWVDVGLVDVVGDQGRHRDALRGSRGGDSHEKHHRHHHRAKLAEEVRGHRGRHQTGASLGGADRQLKGHGREAQ